MTVDFDRERGRDPGLYYLRVFGEPGGAGAVGLAVRRPPRVAEQPRRRRRAGRHHPVLPRRRPGGLPAARRRALPAARPGRGPRPRPGPLARPRAGRARRPARPGPVGHRHRQPHAPSPRATRSSRSRDIWRDGASPSRRSSRPSSRRSATRSTQPSGYDAERPSRGSSTPPPRRACRPASSTPASASCCARCWPPTSTASRTASRRIGRYATTRARRRPLRLGRPDRARRSRTTTGCRARGCSSSGTTPSAGPTTPTRSGATRRPTSASTLSAPTGPRTIQAGSLADRRLRQEPDCRKRHSTLR